MSVLLVEALWQYTDIFRGASTTAGKFSSLFARHLVFGLIVCVGLLPTFISRSIVYGGPFNTGYVSLRDFLWNSPVFFKVLFSSNHGLLSWTPVLLLVLPGLLLFARRLPRVGVPLVIATVSFYLFFSVYPDWAGISSFGNRFFLSLTAIFILGLAVGLEWFAAQFAARQPAIAVSVTILGCFVLWNIGLMYQWGTHLIPARGPISFPQAAYNQVHVVPRQISSQFRNYLFRRSSLMQEIEQKDIQQFRQNEKE